MFVALDVPVEQLCQERSELQRYRKVLLLTVDRLRSLGFALIPTLDRPHDDIVLPDLDDNTLDDSSSASTSQSSTQAELTKLFHMS